MHKVTKITYNQLDPTSVVHVECADGSAYVADHVICTVSLGVLKERHLSLFEPHLPPKKVNSIDGLSIGTVDKIFIEFNEPFWSNGWEGFSLIWQTNELQLLREDPEFNWMEDIFGFFTLNYQPNILCGWISGPNARRMEQMPEETIRIGVMKLLRMFLRNYTVPQPKNLIRYAE